MTGLSASEGPLAGRLTSARLDQTPRDVRVGEKSWVCAVIAVFALQVLLVLMHEPWMDEWQALQIAAQSPRIGDLLANLRYEGHPPLYYLLLRSVASVLPLAWVLPTVQIATAMAIQAIVLFRTFPERADRLLFSLSSFVLFDYGTLARSLSLGVLILLFVFAFRRHRVVWLAIAALPMVDLLFGVLSIACLVIMRREGRWSWAGAMVWLGSSLVAAWTVIPAPDIVTALAPRSAMQAIRTFLGFSGQLLLPFPTDGQSIVWNRTFPAGPAVACGFVFYAMGWKIIRRNRLHAALWLGFVLFAALFSIGVYSLPIRHLSLIALLLIVLEWRTSESGQPPSRLFRTWLGGTALAGMVLAAINLAIPFDAGPRAALWMREQGLSSSHWAAVQKEPASGIAAINGIRLTAIGLDCQQDFVRRNYSVDLGDSARLQTALVRLSDNYGRIHVVSASRIAGVPGLQPLRDFPAGFDGIPYYLYVYRPDLPELPLRPPVCAPKQRVAYPPFEDTGFAWRENVRRALLALTGSSRAP